jgi:hypothetical protein
MVSDMSRPSMHLISSINSPSSLTEEVLLNSAQEKSELGLNQDRKKGKVVCVFN